MDLKDDELRATRLSNGADTKILIDYKILKGKIEETEEWLELKKSELDNDQYYYLSGKLNVLRAIKEGDLSKI